MRPVLIVLVAIGLIVVGAGAASVTTVDRNGPSPDRGGISTSALSRCAGIAGREIRDADASFGQLMLDGVPWLSAQHNHQAVAVSSTGLLRRRNGTTASFHFLCLLDDAGHASMFRITSVDVAETSPPVQTIKGAAVPVGLTTPLPRGTELRIQLLDVRQNPEGDLLAEQVVRSGWEVPIPFALRVPGDTRLGGRQLVIAARIVLARTVIYRLAERRALTADELQRPVMLDLSP